MNRKKHIYYPFIFQNFRNDKQKVVCGDLYNNDLHTFNLLYKQFKQNGAMTILNF